MPTTNNKGKYTDESIGNIVRKYRAFADLFKEQGAEEGRDIPLEMEPDALEEIASVMEQLAEQTGIPPYGSTDRKQGDGTSA